MKKVVLGCAISGFVFLHLFFSHATLLKPKPVEAVVGNLNVDVQTGTTTLKYATASASLSVGTYNAVAGPGNAVFSGRVGIGTSSPASGYVLDVAGGLPINLGGNLRLQGARSLIFEGGGQNEFTWTHAYNNNLHLDTSAVSNALSILESSGAVGIGTGAPSANLDVVNSSGEVRIQVGDDATKKFRFLWDNSVDSGVIDSYYSAAHHNFRVGPSTTFESTGDVGIGTTNPSTTLDVNGDAQISSTLAVTGALSANGGISTDGNTVIDDGAGWHRSYGSTGWQNPTYGGGWYMQDSTWIRTYGSKSLYMNTGTIRNDGGALQLGAGDGDTGQGLLTWDGTNDRIYTGFSGAQGGTYQFYTNGTSNSATATIESNGKITSSANGTAYFCGGDDACIYDVNVASTVGIQGTGGNTGNGAIKLGSSGQTIFGNSTGIAIGTTSPGERFHVYGGQALFQVASTNPVIIDRLTDDGTLLQFKQAGTAEGNISVSGTTVSYNAFTGSHYAWTTDSPQEGQLMSLTGVNRTYNNREGSEPIYGTNITRKANDPAVLGTYLGPLESNKPQSSDNPHLVMAVGNGDMWIVDNGSDIKAGDYLISADTPGHAMKDKGTFSEAYIIGRATENIRWSDIQSFINGKKHTKISVTFEHFVKLNQNDYNDLRNELDQLKKQVETLENKINH